MKTIIRDQVFEGPSIDLGEDKVYANCTFICARFLIARRVDLVSCAIQGPTSLRCFDVSIRFCLFSPHATVRQAPQSPWTLPYDLAFA